MAIPQIISTPQSTPKKSLGLLLVLAALTLTLAILGAISSSSTAFAQGAGRYQAEMRPNESLKACLERLKIKDPSLFKALSEPSIATEIAALPAKTPIQLKVGSDGKVQSLKIPLILKGSAITEVPVLVFVRPSDQPSQLKIIRLQEKTQVQVASKTAAFDGNFFNVMDRQEIPDTVSEQFVRIFSGSVNFPRDITRQANFTMRYEIAYWDGYPITTGKILHSTLTTSQKQYQAFWWKSENDKEGAYYSVDGQALSSLSWKTPILYSRKTSNFGMRSDPFTGKWANHQGIDIGAPIGTEVHATQQGRIKAVGPQGAYGNAVIVEHAGGYETIYGHLSGFAKINANQVVSQGALLGYVGSTGRSTGPHLHYELRKYGEAINPEQSFRISTQTKQLEGDELKAFIRFQNQLLNNQLSDKQLAIH
jgi:murein DD-endopeptidase MepM/ murein hydrolase activator NlpD